MKAAVVLAVGACAWLGVMATPASANSITVTPSSVSAGGTVTLSGDILVNGKPGCGAPGTVTLLSPAFVGLGEFAGEGAVDLPVDATGHFSAQVTLHTSVAVGTHMITGRCGGGNMGVSATLTVTGLPRTGGAIGPVPDADAAAIGAALIAVGGLATIVSRRRRAVTA
jgi:hypothetical protein